MLQHGTPFLGAPAQSAKEGILELMHARATNASLPERAQWEKIEYSVLAFLKRRVFPEGSEEALTIGNITAADNPGDPAIMAMRDRFWSTPHPAPAGIDAISLRNEFKAKVAVPLADALLAGAPPFRVPAMSVRSGILEEIQARATDSASTIEQRIYWGNVQYKVFKQMNETGWFPPGSDGDASLAEILSPASAYTMAATSDITAFNTTHPPGFLATRDATTTVALSHPPSALANVTGQDVTRLHVRFALQGREIPPAAQWILETPVEDAIPADPNVVMTTMVAYPQKTGQAISTAHQQNAPVTLGEVFSFFYQGHFVHFIKTWMAKQQALAKMNDWNTTLAAELVKNNTGAGPNPVGALMALWPNATAYEEGRRTFAGSAPTLPHTHTHPLPPPAQMTSSPTTRMNFQQRAPSCGLSKGTGGVGRSRHFSRLVNPSILQG